MKKQIQLGLFIVAGLSVVAAIIHGFYPRLFDDKSAMFLAVAIVALVIHQISKFKGFGIEFERDLDQLKKTLGELEKSVGPGSKSAATPATAPQLTLEGKQVNNPPGDPTDPNKGQFGGLAERNGRKLSATIMPIAGAASSRCRVHIKVESTDPQRPLKGKVKLYLHPTFGQWTSYELDAIGGSVKDNIVSYGAFTIGVETDDGSTRLELDLGDVPGGTDNFYIE